MKNSLLVSLIALMALPVLSMAQPPQCNSQTIRIHIAQGTQDIIVTPATFNQRQGCDIEVHVPDGYSTRVLSEYDWLGGGADGGSFTMQVPEDVELGDYKYDVEIDGVGRLDPVIRVI